MTESLLCRVTPFGNPGITGCLLLPLAFRSLPRPSSPDSSKASSVDPYSLDHITVCSVSISVAVRRVRPPSPSALLRRLRGRQSRLFAARRCIRSYNHPRNSHSWPLTSLFQLPVCSGLFVKRSWLPTLTGQAPTHYRASISRGGKGTRLPHSVVLTSCSRPPRSLARSIPGPLSRLFGGRSLGPSPLKDSTQANNLVEVKGLEPLTPRMQI